MNTRSLVVALSVLAASVSPASTGRAQSTGRSTTTSVPRTPWGHPDLQGRWTNATVTPLERPAELAGKEFFTAEEAAEYQKHALERFLASINFTEEAAISGEFAEGIWVEPRAIVPTRRTSLIVGPEGRLPPFTPEAQQRANARAASRKHDPADSPEERPLGERCLWFAVGGAPLMPGVGYNSNYQIVQTPAHVAILAEQGYALRIIPLDGRPHAGPAIRQWRGDSRGRWEGDVLVVETTQFNDKVEFRGSRENLRVVERFKRVNDALLMYQFTIDDPTTWTKPWTAEIPMRSLQGLLYEFACHEGNHGLVNILKGARFVDQAGRP
jgi:hypothetical protein